MLEEMAQNFYEIAINLDMFLSCIKKCGKRKFTCNEITGCNLELRSELKG